SRRYAAPARRTPRGCPFGGGTGHSSPERLGLFSWLMYHWNCSKEAAGSATAGSVRSDLPSSEITADVFGHRCRCGHTGVAGAGSAPAGVGQLSEDGALDLQVDDLLHRQSDLLEDRVGVFAVLRR